MARTNEKYLSDWSNYNYNGVAINTENDRKEPKTPKRTEKTQKRTEKIPKRIIMIPKRMHAQTLYWKEDYTGSFPSKSVGAV